MTTSIVARGLACVAAFAGLAASAIAAPVTSGVWEVSQNGGAYASNVVAMPGDVIRVRLRVSLSGNTGTGSIGGVGGFAGMEFLPTLTNFSALDSITPLGPEQWQEGSTRNPFPGVIHHPTLGTVTNVYQGVPATLRGPGNVSTGLGRLAPWGANGVNGNGIPLSQVLDGTLRWRAPVSTVGVSVAMLAADHCAVNAVTGIDDAGTPADFSDDTLIHAIVGSFYNSSRVNVVPFAYEFVVGDAGARVLTQSATSPTLGGAWYMNAAGTAARWAPLSVQTATITILVPSPGTVGMAGVIGLVLASRRRR